MSYNPLYRILNNILFIMDIILYFLVDNNNLLNIMINLKLVEHLDMKQNILEDNMI